MATRSNKKDAAEVGSLPDTQRSSPYDRIDRLPYQEDVDDGDQEEENSRDNRDTEEEQLGPAAQTDQARLRSAKHATHTTAAHLEQHQDNQRNAKDDLYDIEIGLHSPCSSKPKYEDYNTLPLDDKEGLT